MQSDRVPHLRLLITPDCDGKCFFCPGSEGTKGDRSLILSDKEIKSLAEISTEIGFRHVVISGGEPFHRSDLLKILADIKQVNRFKTIRLVTRGLRLEGKASQLKAAGVDVVTISLEAVTPALFKKIFGANGLEKVLRGMWECSKVGLPTVINTVIMKSNLQELPKLISLAGKARAKLKLIDLMDLNQNPELWLKEYVPLSQIDEWLCTKAVQIDEELPLGGLGTPMKRYTLEDGTQIITRDASAGTWYGEICHSCHYYPCQDALISLRITPDGKLRTCLLRDDNLVDVLCPLRKGEVEFVRKAVRGSWSLLVNSKFRPHKWSALAQAELYEKQKSRLGEVFLENKK